MEFCHWVPKSHTIFRGEMKKVQERPCKLSESITSKNDPKM